MRNRIVASLAGIFLLGLGVLASQSPAPAPPAKAFPDPTAPPHWLGPKFKMSQDYPKTLPHEYLPWAQIDFKTEPLRYAKTILRYAFEGNVSPIAGPEVPLEHEWDPLHNPVRTWYHVQWLQREFLHGMTAERTSEAFELDPKQSNRYPSYGVAMYNPRGGYTLGKYWKNYDQPDCAGAQFAEGSVAIKVLFSTATVQQVPYLKGSRVWNVYIPITSTPQSIEQANLLQIDFAVKDARSLVGWVFGTFAYRSEAPADPSLGVKEPWSKVVALGIAWGNDPGVTPSQLDEKCMDGGNPDPPQKIQCLKETWRNPDLGFRPSLGWAARLNGPVDNTISSCIACHSTAEQDLGSPGQPYWAFDDPKRLHWFRNLPGTETFDKGTGAHPLDYSMELADGAYNLYKGVGKPSPCTVPGAMQFVVPHGPSAGPPGRRGETGEARVPQP